MGYNGGGVGGLERGTPAMGGCSLWISRGGGGAWDRKNPPGRGAGGGGGGGLGGWGGVLGGGAGGGGCHATEKIHRDAF